MEKQKVSVHSSENRRFSYKSLLKTQKQKQQVDFWIRKNTIFFRNSDDIPTYACSAPLYIQNRK